MRFAREGLAFMVAADVAALGVVYAAAVRHSWPLVILAGSLVIVALWVAYFFRDPDRQGERGAHLVTAPADGRVMMISAVEEPAFLEGPAVRVSIFMNIFNVHVNRYPVSGIVRYVHYNEGKFINAAHEKASLENEQMSVGIVAGDRRVLVRQIAGLIARRIVNYAQLGGAAEQGERMGIIRFGSRVDLFLPPDATIRVAVGDRTVAGVTAMATLCE